jgi:hypothetical protein
MTEPVPDQLDAPVVTGTTPNVGLPYPETSDSVDVARDVKALALAVDTKFGKPPALSLRKNNAQALPHNSWIGLLFTEKMLDTSGMWSAGDPSKFTATVAGWYRFGGGATIDPNGTGVRSMCFMLNGAFYSPNQTQMQPPTNQTGINAPDTLLYVAAASYVQLVAYQATNPAVTLQVSNAWVAATYVCP